MQLLLDTHIALWAITDDKRLSAAARALILNADNEACVSTVNLWEIAIKHELGKGDMPVSAQQALDYFVAAGYRVLDVTPAHVLALAGLAAIHRDPFDRLLVATAIAEPVHLLTADAVLAGYSELVHQV